MFLKPVSLWRISSICYICRKSIDFISHNSNKKSEITHWKDSIQQKRRRSVSSLWTFIWDLSRLPTSLLNMIKFIGYYRFLIERKFRKQRLNSFPILIWREKPHPIQGRLKLLQWFLSNLTHWCMECLNGIYIKAPLLWWHFIVSYA